VCLVVDAQAGRVVGVENEAGESLGAATALDKLANVHRQRRKPEPPAPDMAVPVPPKGPRKGPNLVELAHAQYYGSGSEARVLEG
jgi:hypothetical protein